jgi:tetratricopeptide (TPR) repeat protein
MKLLRNESRYTLVALAALVAVTGLVYGPSLRAPFIFDDVESVLENPSIVRLWPLGDTGGQPGPLSRFRGSAVAGRPLVNYSLALNYHFGELDPAGYRAVNICLHILSALLLFLIVRRMLSLDRFGDRFAHARQPLALAVALLWAAHPLQTEAVVYVTQRTELMMALFYLACIYAAQRYWSSPTPAQRARWAVVASLASLSGMASKEVMVSVPVVVLLLERTFVTGSIRLAWKNSRALYLGLASGWLLLAFLNYDGPRGHSAGFHGTVPAHLWWMTQARVLALYLKLVVWPHPLAIHYDFAPLDGAAAWPWLLFVALLAFATALLYLRRSAAGTLGVIVLAILSTTLLVPISTEVVAERRMYLPLAALVALIVVGGYHQLHRLVRQPGGGGLATWSHRRLAMGAAGAAGLLLLASCVRSARRLEVYRDELTLWENTVATQPGDAFAHYNLGVVLSRQDKDMQAISHYERAVALDPRYAAAHFNLAVSLSRIGRAPDALPHFASAISLQPNAAGDHAAFGLALAEAGRLPEAIAQFERALALDPRDLSFHAALSDLYAQTNRSALAIVTTERAIQLARATGQDETALRAEAWLANYRARLSDRLPAPARQRGP